MILAWFFVADSRPEAVEENRRTFSFLRKLLRSGPSHLPPPCLIIQANKQDMPGALSPSELAKQLGVDPATPLLGARAIDGGGVLPSFVIAMRLAAERIQALFGANAIEGVPEGSGNANGFTK